MGAANRREVARTRGASSITTVVSSLPNLGAGVRNYVHHVRFRPNKTLGLLRAREPGSLATPEARLAETRRHIADRSHSRRRAAIPVHGRVPPEPPTLRPSVVRSDGSHPVRVPLPDRAIVLFVSRRRSARADDVTLNPKSKTRR
jgi:hypothetical protein